MKLKSLNLLPISHLAYDFFLFDDNYWFNDNVIKIIKDDAIFSVTIVQYEYDFLC